MMVPEIHECVGDVACRGPLHAQVRVAPLEVLVTEVVAARERDLSVDDGHLAMVAQHVSRSQRPEAGLDLLERIRLDARREEAVDDRAIAQEPVPQDEHLHAALGGAHQRVAHASSGDVVHPDEGLHQHLCVGPIDRADQVVEQGIATHVQAHVGFGVVEAHLRQVGRGVRRRPVGGAATFGILRADRDRRSDDGLHEDEPRPQADRAPS